MEDRRPISYDNTPEFARTMQAISHEQVHLARLADFVDWFGRGIDTSGNWPLLRSLAQFELTLPENVAREMRSLMGAAYAESTVLDVFFAELRAASIPCTWRRRVKASLDRLLCGKTRPSQTFLQRRMALVARQIVLASKSG